MDTRGIDDALMGAYTDCGGRLCDKEMGYYKAINGAFSKMFNFATVIGISKLIGYEVRNIGSIAFGVEQKIPVETTMSKLIIKEAE